MMTGQVEHYVLSSLARRYNVSTEDSTLLDIKSLIDTIISEVGIKGMVRTDVKLFYINGISALLRDDILEPEDEVVDSFLYSMIAVIDHCVKSNERLDEILSEIENNSQPYRCSMKNAIIYNGKHPKLFVALNRELTLRKRNSNGVSAFYKVDVICYMKNGEWYVSHSDSLNNKVFSLLQDNKVKILYRSKTFIFDYNSQLQKLRAGKFSNVIVILNKILI